MINQGGTMNLSAVKKKRYRNRKAPYLFVDMWSPCRDSKTIKKTPTLPMWSLWHDRAADVRQVALTH